VKLYVTASSEARAQRRFLELQAKGTPVPLDQVDADMRARDEQDSSRATAPLKPADDAILLDTTGLDADAVFQQALQIVQQRTSSA
jgi:cytidylate kinase